MPRTLRNDGSVMAIQYGPNPQGAKINWIVVKNHGHWWPSNFYKHRMILARQFGPASYALDATAEMWQFFKTHPKV